jgi:hypothetical protein
LTYPLHAQAYFKEHLSKETSAILKDIMSMAASKEDFNREWNGMEKHVDVLHWIACNRHERCRRNNFASLTLINFGLRNVQGQDEDCTLSSTNMIERCMQHQSGAFEKPRSEPEASALQGMQLAHTQAEVENGRGEAEVDAVASDGNMDDLFECREQRQDWKGQHGSSIRDKCVVQEELLQHEDEHVLVKTSDDRVEEHADVPLRREHLSLNPEHRVREQGSMCFDQLTSVRCAEQGHSIDGTGTS